MDPVTESVRADDAEFLGESGAKVTGLSPMEAAWAPEGVEGQGAIAPTMVGAQIFEQVYRPWRGTLNPRWARNYAIFRHHALGLVSNSHYPWGWVTRIVLILVTFASVVNLGLVLISGLTQNFEFHSIFGATRDNIYAHVLGFLPRNTLYYPIAAALLTGGLICEDRRNGMVAIYFSRPINRLDYVGMKFVSAFLPMVAIIVVTLLLYYGVDLVTLGEGWSYVIDTSPVLLSGCVCGILVAFTYTCLGLGFSSVSRNRFVSAISLMAVLLATKGLAFMVDELFERSFLYVFSPYDCMAHIGQVLMGLDPVVDHPVQWSITSLIAMNALAVYVVAVRVASMEVTRE